jgi:hypothetical protein
MNISDTLDADKSFETIGLCNYFGDTADEEVDWDNFFKSKMHLDLQMPSFIRGGEDEDAADLFNFSVKF